jgi:superfamily II DNA or RNA helicase
MDRYPVAFDSFDRLFPNQDTLPKGGFGNLIALPLQREPRNSGNSVFIDEQNVPYPDQWAVLAGIERVSRVELTSLLPRTNGPLDRALKVPGQTFKQEKPGSVPIPLIATKEYPPESPSLPWNRTPSGDWLRESVPLVLTQGSIKAVRANLFFVEKQFLPARLRNQLLSIAAFGNPEYYKAQKMRLPVWNKPRVISCGEDHPDYIGLPRGCEDEAIQILRHCNASVEVEDRRNQGTPISITFVGELTAEQSRAVQQILKEENGVLCAPTGFGKTVAAASVIAGRARNTLVLVHRKRLAQQWVERLREFLDLQEEEIGVLDPKRRTATRVIDVALVQGLIRNGVVDDVVADYGNVVVDECHHVSAFSFEEVLKRVRSTYVLGLTATPVRQDGRHPIIHMQCGPIRYRVDERAEAQRHGFEHGLLVRETSLRIDEAEQKPIHEVYQRLVEDDERNILITDDIVRAVERGRVPLVLSERKRHLQLIKERIEERGLDCTLLVGGMGKKRTAEALEMLHAQDKSVLLATGKLIGEGFDHPQLDTLFLTFPVSWKGVVQQYVGRIHRRHAGKDEVRVYDYVDRQVPVLAASFKRRAKSYRIMGYKVKGEESDRRD